MLINCPSCNQRISDKHRACPHCAFDFRKLGEGISLEEASARTRNLRMYRLRQQTYVSMALTLVGLLIMVFQKGRISIDEPHIGLFLFMGGAVWYLITRIRTVIVRRQ